MTDTLLLTLQKIFTLFTFISVGYFLKRKALLPKECSKVLSFLGTNVIYPAYLVKNLATSFTRENLSLNLPLFLWGLVFLGAVLALGFVVALCLKKTSIPRNTLIYIFAFSNYGYFGYPVMEGVFGKEFVAKAIVFAIPSSIAIGSIGYFLLMGKGKSVAKSLLSPSVIAIVVGCLLGISGILETATQDVTVVNTVLTFVNDTLSTASNCMSTVTMLLTGFVLGSFSLKDLFKSPVSYLIGVLRLMLMPAITATVLYFLGVRGLLFAIPVIITAMPVGMNTVLFTEAAGKDSSESARICFISYIMGIITVPLAFSLAAFLGGL